MSIEEEFNRKLLGVILVQGASFCKISEIFFHTLVSVALSHELSVIFQLLFHSWAILNSI